MINKNIRASEAHYRLLFESAKDGILLLNHDTAQVEDVNPFLIELLGYSYEEFLDKKIWELGAFVDTALNKEAFIELKTNHYIRYDDLPLMAKDGTKFSVEFVSNVYDCDDIQVIQCHIRDNTKRNLAEIALKATTRALNMISEGNIALLNSQTEQTLLSEFCRIAVQTGGYAMAWVGLTEGEGDDKKVKILSQAGEDDGFLTSSGIIWKEENPTTRAIRTRTVQLVGDISSELQTPWYKEALKRGYRSVIALPFKLNEDTTACLTLYSAKTDIYSHNERELLQDLASDISYGISTLRTAAEKILYEIRLRDTLEQTIQVIANTGEERDAYTAGHQRRVAGLCTQIATELGLSQDRIHGLHLASTIHDLGKIGIPAEILSKPRRLTELEFGLIKEHPTIAFNILKTIDFPWPIATIVIQHHERIDGSGYPMGLKGDELLLESKILAVADVVEAMASHRPYRAELGIDAALKEITSQRGITLDAQAVDACLRVFNEQNYKFEQ